MMEKDDKKGEFGWYDFCQQILYATNSKLTDVLKTFQSTKL